MNVAEAVRQITTCTVLTVEGYSAGAVARGYPCEEPADWVVFSECRCGHSSWNGQCYDHAELFDRDPCELECLTCNAAGHYCQMEIKVKAAAR